MSGKRVFLTGCTGFVGSFSARALLHKGCNVSVLIRPGSSTRRIDDILHDLNVVQGDLSSTETIDAEFRRVPPEIIVHLAWSGVGNSARNDLIQLPNIPASAGLLEAGIRHGCRTWVGLGSQAEYGTHSGVISESTPVAPTTVYGVTKLAACHLTSEICRTNRVRFAWIRLFSSYGPMNDPSWMLPYLTRKLLNGERPSLTACEQLWDYVYVADVAEAVAALALDPSAEGVFNIGSGKAWPLRLIVESVRDLIDPALPLGFGEVPYRPDQVMHLEADISRMRSVTGWAPQISLEEGLRRSVEWERSHWGNE